MALPNEIVLRPRFSQKLDVRSEVALTAFEKVSKSSKDFVVSRVDDHVFIQIPKNKQHFWSPQLHLEIYTIEEGETQLRGLFGPNPTIWTLFMFAHFIVATCFIGAGIWLYTNATLGEEIIFPVISMVLLFIIWFVLYFAGRLGRHAGKTEMKALYSFMRETLQNSDEIY